MLNTMMAATASEWVQDWVKVDTMQSGYTMALYITEQDRAVRQIMARIAELPPRAGASWTTLLRRLNYKGGRKYTSAVRSLLQAIG